MKERILVGKDIISFLTKNILPNNLFVSIGYLNDGALGYGPHTRKKINAENDKRLSRYLAGKELENSPRFRSRLQSFKDSEKYSQVLAGQRNSAPMDITGDVHIIKISRTVIRWLQNGRFLSKYHEWGNEEQNIRLRHGFGRPETEYPENDWRRKPEYQGLNASRTKDPNRTHTKKYTQSIGQSGLFRDPNDPDSMAFRQFTDLTLADRPEWYFIDEDGTAEKLNNYVLRFLRTEYSVHKVKEAMQEIADDEKEFLDDLQQLLDRSKSENEFALENILYMTGTTITPAGEKQPFTWINTTYLYKKYPWLDKEFVNSVVSKHVAFSKEDIDKLSESFISNSKFENLLLEAINKGIKLALDDYDFDQTNLQPSTSNIIDSYHFAEYVRFRDIINKLLNGDPSLPRKLDQIIVYKEMVQLHNDYGFLYKVKTLDELKGIIEKFINIWRTTTKNFNWIDVSSLTSLKYAFSIPSIRDTIGDVEIDEWDVSNVTDISFMAWNCKWFNADLSKWDVHNVKLAVGSFLGCKKFNSDLSNWDVRNLKDAGSMFLYCDEFNSDLSKWRTSNLIDASQMFTECKEFNSDLSNWDVRNVQSANLMFWGCEQFNQDLSDWKLNKCNNINRGQWFRQMFDHTPMEHKFDFYPPKLVTPEMKKK